MGGSNPHFIVDFLEILINNKLNMIKELYFSCPDK